MPALAPDTLRRLLEAGDGRAVHYENQPLPRVVDASLAGRTSELLEQGTRAVRDWQQEVDAVSLDPGLRPSRMPTPPRSS